MCVCVCVCRGEFRGCECKAAGAFRPITCKSWWVFFLSCFILGAIIHSVDTWMAHNRKTCKDVWDKDGRVKLT